MQPSNVLSALLTNSCVYCNTQGFFLVHSISSTTEELRPKRKSLKPQEKPLNFTLSVVLLVRIQGCVWMLKWPQQLGSCLPLAVSSPAVQRPGGRHPAPSTRKMKRMKMRILPPQNEDSRKWNIQNAAQVFLMGVPIWILLVSCLGLHCVQ